MPGSDAQIVVTVRGRVGSPLRQYAEEKLARALDLAPRPVLLARLVLQEERNPALERPAVAKASADVGGRLVRAHVAAGTMREAVDLLEARLRRRLEILSEQLEARRSGQGDAQPGEWRHASMPTERPPYFPRPPEEREIVRRKTYAAAPVTPAEASVELELLDHDFHLFTDAETGRESVVHRAEDGSLAVVDASPVESLADAEEQLDVTDAPFVFFVERASGRGHVLYRRYDGHYGLVEPAS